MPRALLPLAIFLTSAAVAETIEPSSGVTTPIAADAAKGTPTEGSGVAGADANKLVCRRISKPGSLISRPKKVCMTKQEWDEQAKQYQQMDGSNANSGQSQCAGGSGYGPGAC